MKSLSFLHRWSGGLIGLLLALLGLSGAILVWEGEWISLPHSNDPVVERVDSLAAIAQREAAAGALRITFASEEIGLHHVARDGGAGAYVAQDGTMVTAWTSQWQRPEFWLFDFHHHLFAGETGELVTLFAGVAGLLFVITGSILWWRSRRAFRWRLWPTAIKPGPIVSHHRDFGIVVAPLLLVSLLTGIAMLAPSATSIALAPFGKLEKPAKPPEAAEVEGPAAFGTMLATAKTQFPDAAIRRLSFPSKPGQPYSVRMKQPVEWTPNGRTTLYFDGAGRLLRTDDPASAGKAASINETFYPLHGAKVGGLAWKLAMTLSGLGLTLLGALATWSFWIRKARRKPVPRRPAVLASDAA